MTRRSIVRLKILSSSLTPEMLDVRLGLHSDKSWHAGDFRRHTQIIEKKNGWILNSGAEETVSFNVQIEQLISRLEPLTDVLKDIATEADVEVSCVIYADTAPALSLSSQLLGRMCLLHAGLDIDLYIG